MSDFNARTKIAWDSARDGYFIHTEWEAAEHDPESGEHARTFFKNLIKNDAGIIFLGNYNRARGKERIRASSIAHEQLKLILSLSYRDRDWLHTHPGRKMTIDEIRESRRQTTSLRTSEDDASEDGGSAAARCEVETPLRTITRSDVVNEATKAAMKSYVGQHDVRGMRQALRVSLTETPNGGSTRRFLELQNLRADSIDVLPKGTLPGGQPDHTKGYDIVLTCSPIDGPGRS